MLKMLDLFSGIGGFSLAASWTGAIETIAFCEIEPFCQKVLKKHWPDVPIFSDIKELHWWTEEGILCERQHSKQPALETLPKQIKQSWQGELFESVNAAESECLCHQVSPIGDGDSVLGNADRSQCAGIMPQTPTVDSGCRVKTTPTGRTEPAINAAENIKHSPKRCSGEEGCSPGTTIPANNAGINPTPGEGLTPTISSPGKTTQKNDSILSTESPCASSATEKPMQRRQHIDILTAGTPCQPASCAGKQRGTADDRWLWGEVLRIVREAHPTWCIFENVGGLLALEGGLVFEDLLSQVEAEGYEVQPLIIPACGVNAPHKRERVWIIAYRDGNNSKSWRPQPAGQQRAAGIADGGYDVAHPATVYVQGQHPRQRQEQSWGGSWWSVEPAVGRVAHGIPSRVDRLKGLGNAIVPQVAYPILQGVVDIEIARRAEI
jgi:DNA (cytosine-5)-methyltransferase 1